MHSYMCQCVTAIDCVLHENEAFAQIELTRHAIPHPTIAPKKIIDWKFGMSQKQTVKQNTEVEFRWDLPHSVYKFPDKSAFDACDFTKAIELASTSGYTYKASAAGTFYFACSLSKGFHCTVGIKLALTVTGNG